MCNNGTGDIIILKLSSCLPCLEATDKEAVYPYLLCLIHGKFTE